MANTNQYMWKNRKPNIVCNRRPNNKTIYWMIFCFYGHKAAFLCLLTTTWALHNSVLCTRENPIYFLSLSFRLKLDLRIMCNKSIKSENIINALAYPKTSISLHTTFLFKYVLRLQFLWLSLKKNSRFLRMLLEETLKLAQIK